MTAPAKDFKAPPPKHPLDVVRRARDEHGITHAIVGFSGGKDALATLALCCETFGAGNVYVFWMYMVCGLTFQERFLSAIERRYTLPAPILRIPHWALSRVFRSAEFRHQTQQSRSVKLVSMRDIDAYVRKQATIQAGFPSNAWIATGEKACDSIERNAVIRKADGIDPARRRFWPIAWWNDAAVFNYLKSRQMPLPPEYRTGGAAGKRQYTKSFGGLWYRDVVFVRDNYPEDWERVKRLFPLIESQLSRYEAKEERKAAAYRGRLIVEGVEDSKNPEATTGTEDDYGEGEGTEN